MKSIRPEYPKIRRHLSRRDPVMRDLIKRIGPCTLQITDDYFALLVRSIISQQISTKAAKSISGRLAKFLGKRGVRPAGIRNADDEGLRQCGLSTAKRRALRDLAEKVSAREVQLKKLIEKDDDDVIAHLLPVRGIGRWTAEMFLIFGLGRLDVLPTADLGLRVGVKNLYKLDDRPGDEQLQALAEPWQPYRSIATWYVWRSFGDVPQSEAKKKDKK